MLDNNRAQLATAQKALAESLISPRASNPEGFDLVRLQLAARMLYSKRLHGIKRLFPAATAALGDELPSQFSRFAAISSYPSPDGGIRDGQRFLRWTHSNRRLPLRAAIELILSELHHNGSHSPVRIIASERHFVAAVRIPRVGIWCVQIPIAWPTRAVISSCQTSLRRACDRYHLTLPTAVSGSGVNEQIDLDH